MYSTTGAELQEEMAANQIPPDRNARLDEENIELNIENIDQIDSCSYAPWL